MLNFFQILMAVCKILKVLAHPLRCHASESLELLRQFEAL